MLAWLAGEAWKLKAFRDYDTFKLDAQGHRISDGKGDWARLGHDLYVLAYAGSFGVPPESVTKDQRQIGKVQELALGYQGGVGAFLTFAAAYGIDLEAMGSKAYASLPTETRDQADHSWDWAVEKKQTYGLSQTAYVVCDGFKRLWRQAHPNVVAFWTELETAVRDAIALPGRSYPVRRLEVRYQAPWLGIRLPSGRILLYFNPRVEDSKNGRGVISYEGISQYSRKWVRLKTYGGKLVENVTQAAARDVLAYSMPRVEAAGYPILLSVHDELITAGAIDGPGHEGLSAILATAPPWAPGLPLAAGGFTTQRYRKG
jgi:DNA polymerase